MRILSWRLVRYGAVVLACLLGAGWSLEQLSGDSGLVTIGDDEVAVVYNRLTGSARQIDRPGNVLFVPFVERVHLQRRSPARLVMDGEERVDALRVPALRLRASDGTLVRFESFELQFLPRLDDARVALEDGRAGVAHGARLVEAFVRGIVRDEYGLFNSETIVLRANQKAASARVRARLDEALTAHGIQVLELSAPRLRFDSTYEKAVESGEIAVQEVERLKAEFAQLDAEREQRLATLEKDKTIELAKSNLQVRDYIAKVQRDLRERENDLENYATQRLGEGQARGFQLAQQAAARRQAITLAADVLRDEVARLEENGAPLVREAWIARLAQTPVTIRPYSQDPSPSGVEVLQTALKN